MTDSERTPPPPDEERPLAEPDLTVPTTGSEGPDTTETTAGEDAGEVLEEKPEPQEPPD